MTNKFKAIILLIALVIGGLFITNMSPSDDKLKRQNNQLKTQITEIMDYNNSLKEQNKKYESTIGSLQEENQAKDLVIDSYQEQLANADNIIKDLQAQIDEFNSKHVTDLTNTTWVFNDTINSMSTYFGDCVEYEIDFISNNEESSYIMTYSWFENDGPMGPFGQNDLIYSFSTVCSGEVQTLVLSNWTDEAYKTISITGGDDVTNVDLINWLYANATLVK